ncbi:MAG: hypothetical protein K2N94_00420 [Lachnospiraceae bacterium]|nr:hypothetical protein [Lachnospiraceae bacterium]
MLNEIGGTSLFSQAQVTIGRDRESGVRTAGGRKKNKKLKSLNYNARDIAAQLMRAREVKAASDVLCRAKSKVNTLRRCLGSGMYENSEVWKAIAHANRMVDCASMKLRNLEEEEAERRNNEKANKRGAGRLHSESKRRALRKSQEIRLKQKKESLERKMKTQELQLEQKKRMHRSRENGKINEAAMSYWKSRPRQAQRVDCDGVMLELSISAAQLSELARDRQSLRQIERQLVQEQAVQAAAAQESAGPVSAPTGEPALSAGAEGAAAGGEGGAAASAAVPVSTVDVQV